MDRREGKILGVIGGMGPLATELFYNMIIRKTDAHRDQDHINTIILSHATMPDRTTAIKEKKLDDVTNKLIEDAIFLENAGASVIAVPCNTSHVILPIVQEKISIPIINMIKETSNYIYNKFNKKKIKVGIMATDGTMEIGLYQKECKEHGLEIAEISIENQRRVMKIIYDGIKEGGPIDKNDFIEIEDGFKKQGCDCVILACTELSCYKKMENLDDFYIDAMEILAEKAIVMCDKKLEK